jgi:hypothetical protein
LLILNFKKFQTCSSSLSLAPSSLLQINQATSTVDTTTPRRTTMVTGGSDNNGDSSVRTGKRKAEGLKGDDSLCTLCQKNPAAVTVKTVHLSNNARGVIGTASSTSRVFRRQSYCLLHYYTTRAVRTAKEGDVAIVDQAEFDKQLVPMQKLFSEAFVQLQQSLSEASARAFAAQQHDPLAVLHDLSRSATTSRATEAFRKRKEPPLGAGSQLDKKMGPSSSGGFLRELPIPERLLHTQQQQAKAQQAMARRMEQAAAAAAAAAVAARNSKPDLSRRRKSSRKSIWNSVLDDNDEKSIVKKDPPQQQQQQQEASMVHSSKCGCGSSNVEIVSTSSSRNQDMPKGETWGSKDRGNEVVTRYRCLSCGKTWNEEE